MRTILLENTILYFFYYISLLWLCIRVGAHEPCTHVGSRKLVQWLELNRLSGWVAKTQPHHEHGNHHFTELLYKVRELGGTKDSWTFLGVMCNLLVERASCSCTSGPPGTKSQVVLCRASFRTKEGPSWSAALSRPTALTRFHWE